MTEFTVTEITVACQKSGTQDAKVGPVTQDSQFPQWYTGKVGPRTLRWNPRVGPGTQDPQVGP